ncbi:hypothetical protein Lnau_2917 [Legionella nautarum]|uniref:Uncharacterized protein n=1 Tax=Legionella nautarum TaxID=45070 RepID=A0A0W0WLR3_9GAMM|nr:hypothetical protein [Legionella nautarum]KTD33269.1 hypothetical protein Lnau_2917 [Legionella nautarum]
MPGVAEQLDYLAGLQESMEHASTIIRKQLAEGALIKLQGEVGDSFMLSINNRDAIRELRWRNYQQLQNDSDASSEDTSSTKLTLFILIGNRFVAKEKVTEQRPKEEELKKLIQQQKELIFSQYLAGATREYLEAFKHNPNQQFSRQTILDKAIELYKEQIYKIALLEYEVVNLVGYYARLRGNSARSPDEGKIEKLLAIEKTFDSYSSSQSSYNFDLFKFNNIESLYYELQLAENLSAENLEENLKSSLNLGKPKTLQDSLHNQILSNIFAENLITLAPQKALSTLLKETEQMMATITTPEEVGETAPIGLPDESIIKLRTIVAEYEAYLNGIIVQESVDYPNRKDGAVDNRKKALERIILDVNNATKLTPHLKSVVKDAVDEIIANEPTWFEKSLLDQILDIIFARPLFRWMFGSKPQAQSDLHQQSETLAPENPQDKKDDSKDEDKAPQNHTQTP